MSVGQEMIIKNILTDAIKRGASDLHFSVGNSPILRINDSLMLLDDKELVTSEFIQGMVDMILDDNDKKKLTTNREIVLAHNFDKNLRFKINIFFQRGFLSVSLRYIPYVVPSLASLKLNSILPSLIENSSGLIIVSGPFGSGRSTTIAAMIEAINQSRKEYIISIEEPIEYIHTNSQSIIEQREVGRDTNSFKDALRYFEEENGDVLFLEEMSQPDIVPMVLEIARGNALVFTAISADSASNTISRILDLFPAYDQDRIRNLLATSLRAIVCQKVIPRIGGGVVVAQEILIANGAVKSIILGGNIPGLNNIIQTSRQEGMISFSHVLAELVKSRQISMEDALDQVIDKKIFESLLR